MLGLLDRRAVWIYRAEVKVAMKCVDTTRVDISVPVDANCPRTQAKQQ